MGSNSYITHRMFVAALKGAEAPAPPFGSAETSEAAKPASRSVNGRSRTDVPVVRGTLSWWDLPVARSGAAS